MSLLELAAVKESTEWSNTAPETLDSVKSNSGEYASLRPILLSVLS
jgi:hypothetical protein